MPIARQEITPCLWFDGTAEDAAKFYVTVFRNSKINKVSYYCKAGEEVHGGKEGSVLAVDFELDGHRFTGLNGGPRFKFTEAVSFQIPCDSQDEIDAFWGKLSAGGTEGPCGWVKDKFGLSWQVFPRRLHDMLKDSDTVKAERAMNAMLKMSKMDLATLERAYAGQ